MVELVDTQDLKSCDHCGRAGSSPARGTVPKQLIIQRFGIFIYIKLVTDFQNFYKVAPMSAEMGAEFFIF